MSIAKVTHITRSAKEYKCEKCGATIEKGTAYRRFKVGFRSRYNHYRCMKTECTPRRSELDASKMSAVWDAQETFEAAIESAESADDFTSALTDYADALREVGEEYREASEGESGQVFNTVAEERADMLEEAADEVDGIDVDDETTDCEECNGTGETTVDDVTGECEACEGEGTVPDIEAMRERAREALDVDLP